jgi:hypothetical protein
MSPTLNPNQAKTILKRDIEQITNILRYKRLETAEMSYVLRAVLSAKAMYYLNTVPLTDTELTGIDRQIAALLKKSARLARSTSPHILHLPTKAFGYNFPSLVHQRRNLLIGQLHRLMNNTGLLGSLARVRLAGYRETLGAHCSPLSGAAQYIPPPSKSLLRSHWMARAHACLLATNITLLDPCGDFNRKPLRPKDHPILERIPRHLHPHIAPELRKRNWVWTGHIANARGTHIRPGVSLNIPCNPRWWRELVTALTTDGSRLAQPVSPTPSALPYLTTSLRPDTYGFYPNETTAPGGQTVTFSHIKNGKYVHIINYYRDKDNTEWCDWKEVTKDPTPFTHIRDLNIMSYSPITGPFTVLTVPPSAHVMTCRDNSIIPLPHRWVTVRDGKRRAVKGVLLTTRHTIPTSSQTLSGITPTALISSLQEALQQSFFRDEEGNVYSDDETFSDVGSCEVCGLTGRLFRCTPRTHCTTGWYHPQCLDNPPAQSDDDWTCPKCARPPNDIPAPTHAPLPIEEGGPCPVTAGDGSVKSNTTSPSTWGLAIRTNEDTYSSVGGAISIHPLEASSLRSELEALTQLYLTTPSHIQPHHACDSSEAIRIHNDIDYIYNPEGRRWTQIPYRSTIARLRWAMYERGGTPIHLTHTLSHLEHRPSPNDELLALRRLTLQQADEAATAAHDLPTPKTEIGGVERFPLSTQGHIIQKSHRPFTELAFEAQTIERLRGMSLEGKLLRHIELTEIDPGNLPPHLTSLRSKLFLSRLPTRATRALRNDKHSDGSLISPNCPLGHNLTPETIPHFLLECPPPAHFAAARMAIARPWRSLFAPNHHNNVRAYTTLRTKWPALIPSRTWEVNSKPDKHGRFNTIQSGPPALTHPMEHLSPIRPDWLLQLTTDNPHTPLSELVLQQPRRCIDPLLISLLSLTMTPEPQIFSPIPSNPLLPSGNKGLTEIPEHTDDRPILIDASTSPSKTIDTYLATMNNHPILMITTNGTWKGLKPLAEIPPKSIPVLQASFWKGATRTYSEPFAHSLYVYCTTKIDCLKVKEAIHAVSLIATHTPPSYSPEFTSIILPPAVASTLDDDHQVQEQRVLLHSGLISAPVLRALAEDVPSAYVPKMYRQIHVGILENVYSRWIHRNENVRDLDRIILDSKLRQRTKRPTPKPPQNPRPPKRAQRWHADRDALLARRTQWNKWASTNSPPTTPPTQTNPALTPRASPPTAGEETPDAAVPEPSAAQGGSPSTATQLANDPHILPPISEPTDSSTPNSEPHILLAEVALPPSLEMETPPSEPPALEVPASQTAEQSDVEPSTLPENTPQTLPASADVPPTPHETGPAPRPPTLAVLPPQDTTRQRPAKRALQTYRAPIATLKRSRRTTKRPSTPPDSNQPQKKIRWSAKRPAPTMTEHPPPLKRLCRLSRSDSSDGGPGPPTPPR